MRYINYYEYIRSSEWKEKAKKAKERSGWRCQICNRSAKTIRLDAHHRTYERLGEEDPMDLTVLCQRCHSHNEKFLAKAKDPETVEYICKKILHEEWIPDLGDSKSVFKSCDSVIQRTYLIGALIYFHSNADWRDYFSIRDYMDDNRYPGVFIGDAWQVLPYGIGPSSMLIVPNYEGFPFMIAISSENGGGVDWSTWSIWCYIQFNAETNNNSGEIPIINTTLNDPKFWFFQVAEHFYAWEWEHLQR